MSDFYASRSRWSYPDPDQPDDPASFEDWRSRPTDPDVMKETVRRLGDPNMRYDPETRALQIFGTKPDGYLGYYPLKPEEERAAKEQAFGGASRPTDAAPPQDQRSVLERSLSTGQGPGMAAAFNSGGGRPGSNRDNPNFQLAARQGQTDWGRAGPDDRLRDTQTPVFMRDLQSDSADTHASNPLLTSASFRSGVKGSDSNGPAAASYAFAPAGRDWRNQERIHVREGVGYFTTKQSSTAKFLETPRILALEQKYWEAADADNPDPSKRHETGFWVYMKNGSNSLDDIRILDRGDAIAKDGLNRAMNGRGPVIPGYTLVMDFHVHPFDQEGLFLPAPARARGPVPRRIPFKGAPGPHSADQSVLAGEEAEQASGRSRGYGVPVLGVIRSHHGNYYYGPGSH